MLAQRKQATIDEILFIFYSLIGRYYQVNLRGLFNHTAQVWNHTFYCLGLRHQGQKEPEGALADAIVLKWGSFDAFKKVFEQVAVSMLGSAWVCLIKTQAGQLDVVSTSNAAMPITEEGVTPLLTSDVWEHACYID